MNKSQQKGFTLVEMSIVLVIIGLIVGGVLVGQDLVKGAQIRATVSQIESFNSAINTFRGKYDCMPGDCAKAVAYGLTVNGSGDGVISAGAAAVFDNSEMEQFWVHLSEANMVAGNYTNTATPWIAGVDYPATKLKKGGILIANVSAGGTTPITLSSGMNVWIVGAAASIAADAADFATTAAPALNGAEAFGIDNKLDDGMPSTGQANVADSTELGTTTTTSVGFVAPAAGAECQTTVTVEEYSIGNESNECALIIRVQG